MNTTKLSVALLTRLSITAAAIVLMANVSSCTKNALDEGSLIENAAKSEKQFTAVLNAEGQLQVNLPSDYNAVPTSIPKVILSTGSEETALELLGGIEFTLNNIPADAFWLTFKASTPVAGKMTMNPETGSVIAGDEQIEIRMPISKNIEWEGGTQSFLIPLPAGTYTDYSVNVAERDNSILYGKVGGEDDEIVVKAGRSSVLEDGSMFAYGTKAVANKTSATRPWENDIVIHNPLTEKQTKDNSYRAFDLADSRYTVGQYLGHKNVKNPTTGVISQHSDIMQSFHVEAKGDNDGAIFFCHTRKIYGQDGYVRKRNLRVVKVLPKRSPTDALVETQYNAMEFDWFGHGQGLSAEETSSGQYLWLGSYGREVNKNDETKYSECSSSQTIARVKWNGSKETGIIPVIKRDSSIVTHFVYRTSKVKSTSNMECSVYQSTYGDIICFERKEGTKRVFRVYELSKVLALKAKEFTVSAATTDATVKIQAKNIAELTLNKGLIFETSFDEKDLAFLGKCYDGNLAYQGFDIVRCVENGYRIYALYGCGSNVITQGNSYAPKRTAAYVVTTEWVGGSPRNFEYSYVRPFYYTAQLDNAFYTSVSNFYNANWAPDPTRFKGDPSVSYYEVEGIRVARNDDTQKGKLYIGFASKMVGDQPCCYRANIYKCGRY